MSRLILIQTNFSTGETDPLIRGRIDLNQYYSALQKATNVTIIPQGGVRRRPGLRYVSELPSTIADDGVIFAPFEFSVNDSYIFSIIAGRIYVFKNGSQITQIASTISSTYSQTGTTITVTAASHGLIAGDTVYLDFTSGTAVDGSFTVATASSGSFTVTAAGSLSTSGNVTMKPNHIIAPTITAAMLPDLNYAQSADTMLFVHEDLAPLKLVRGATDASWTLSAISFDFIPKHAFTLTKTSPSSTITASAKEGTIELSAAGGVFSAADVGQYVHIKEGYGFGIARVIGYISSSKLLAVTEIPFDKTSAYGSGEWEIQSGYEDVWSVSRGWPKSVTFHEGRLYFGGSKGRPSTVWGSVVGRFFDFDKGQSLDDEAVESTVDTNQLNAIVNCFSGRDLQFFTTGSEFYVPQGQLEPITPTNFFVKIATRNGCKPSIKPVGLDSGTLFVQRQGKSLNEFVFTDVEAAYVTNRISLLSSHLLKTPIDMAIRRATSTDESDQLYIVNDDDGSMVCYSMLRSQQVIAPSEFITDGEFLAVGVDVDTIYVAVKRVINGSDKYFIERFDSSLTVDCAVIGTSGSSVTAANLAGETVKIIADGVVLPDATASSVGVITFSRAAVSSYQVGLNYNIEVKTMPVEPRLQSGNLRGFKKRIIEVTPEFYETQSASINGQVIPFRQFDTQVLDEPVAEYTGIKKIGPLLGFDYEGVITVTQSVPLKMTLLFLEYQVSAGQ
jgi:hypothetical protein